MKRALVLILAAATLMTILVTPSVAGNTVSNQSSRISAGLVHYAVLKDDGTVWSWGNNLSHELGDGTNIFREKPVQSKGISGVKSVSAGIGLTIVLKKDGTVWAWGQNENSSLIKGTHNNALKPVQITGLKDIVAISGKVAFKKDGTVWEWGYHEPNKADYVPPSLVKGLKDVVEISSGEGSVNLALKKDGTVAAWNYYGNNIFGQLGNGTTEKTFGPVQVKGLTDVIEVSAGVTFGLALKKDGTVWAWGKDEFLWGGYWQTLKNSSIPVRIEGLTDVIKICAGEKKATVLKKDGTVWQWGFLRRKLKDGSTLTEPTNIPKQVMGLTNITEISARFNNGVALKSDGTIWKWSGLDDAAQVPIKLLP